MSAYLVVLVILWIFAPPAVQTEEPEVVEITSPVPGQALQGIVPVFGTVRTNRGFISGRLVFSYEADDRGSWFEVGPVPRMVEESELGIWDTTSLTDGNYALRLEVSLASGEVITHTVSGLRVRNYSMIETDTPAPTQTLPPDSGPTREPPSAPTSTRRPSTPTLLPPNPAEITVAQLSGSAGRGVLITLAVFAALGFLVLRRRFKP
ncbi:MAG TPA: hypothetical protein VJ768_03120 [Anaerolineales bacterium]|nr:hypothetical protein [Anaerolineales bacterium]